MKAHHVKMFGLIVAVMVAVGSSGIVLAATQTGTPKFCADKKLGRLEQPICDLYGLVGGMKTQIAELKTTSAAQSDKIAALESRVKALEPTPTPSPSPTPTACGGGYPAMWCNAPQDSLVDPWGMYNRECTSYAAFRVASSGRTMPYWGGRGNASQWPANARAAGIAVDGTPRVGDIAISMAGPYGFAMYVEAVIGDKVHLSQYNYGNNGEYSEMTISAAGLSFIHF